MKCIAHGLCGLCGMLWYCGACCCRQRAFMSVQVTCTRSAWTEVGITQWTSPWRMASTIWVSVSVPEWCSMVWEGVVWWCEWDVIGYYRRKGGWEVLLRVWGCKGGMVFTMYIHLHRGWCGDIMNGVEWFFLENQARLRMTCHFKLSLQCNVLPIMWQCEVTSHSLVCLIVQKESLYYQL